MNKKYLQTIQRLNRFNDWERSLARDLPEAKRLEQFTILFDLGQRFPASKIELRHKQHLTQLIKIQNQFKLAQESNRPDFVWKEPR